ncbi:hypothetical protein JCM8097_005080 [Rhodosporidiobolus ruineniae]
MLARRCTNGLKQRGIRPELSAALAQLPAFLVPSFAAQVEEERVRRDGAEERETAHGRRGTAAPTTRSSRPSALTSWLPPSSSARLSARSALLRPPSLVRTVSTQAGLAAVEAVEVEEEGAVWSEAGPQRRRADSGASALPSDATSSSARPPRPPPKPKPRNRRRSPSSPSDTLPDRPSPPEAGDSDFVDASSFPTTRSAVLDHLLALPKAHTLPALLCYRRLVKDAGFLADPDCAMVLMSRMLTNGYDGAALRLASETANLARDRADEPAVRAKLVEMYERALRSLTRRTVQAGQTARNGRPVVRWSAVLELTTSALSRGVVSPVILSIRMRALYEFKRYGDIDATFSLFAQHGFAPSSNDYDEAILARLLDHKLQLAQDLLAEKGERGHPTTSRTCLALLEGMAVYGGNKRMEDRMLFEVDEAALAAKTAPRQDIKVLNKVMSVRAARGSLADALSVLEDLDLSAFPPALVSQTYALSQRPSSSDSVDYHSLPPPPHWRPHPDLSTIVTLVGITLREQRVDLALQLIATAHRLDMGFSVHVAGAIVRTLLALHDISAAEQFLYSLPSGSANFVGLAYPALIPSMQNYEALFEGLLRYRGLQAANDALDYLQKEQRVSLRASEGMTRALVQHLALEAHKSPSVSADVLVDVQELTSGKTRPSARHLDLLLRAAWQNERLRSAGKGLALEDDFPFPEEGDLAPPPRRQAKVPPPTARPAEAELLSPSSGSRNATNPTSLSRIHDSLSDRDYRALRSSTRHVLRNDYLLRFIPAKWAYLQSQVLDLGVRPTVHHVTVLLRAYLVLGDTKGAHLALRYALDELKLPPHVAFYSTLIAGLARLGDHAGAEAAYREMLDLDVAPDRTLFAALAMLFARRRDVQGVERVLSDVRKHARAQTPHPQLLALAHAQALRAKKSGGGVPGALMRPYDPLLDVVFVSILYRTLVATGRLADALDRVQKSLEDGLVPDQVLVLALRRTERWLVRKRNFAVARAVVADPAEAEGLSKRARKRAEEAVAAAEAEAAATQEKREGAGLGYAQLGTTGRLTVAELDDLLGRVKRLVARTVAETRGMKHTISWEQMARLQAYWRGLEVKNEDEQGLRRGPGSWKGGNWRVKKRRDLSERELDEQDAREEETDLDAELRMLTEESR